MKINRRNFMKSTALAGAGMMLAKSAVAQAGKGSALNELNVGIIGAGKQGRILIQDTLPIPNVRFRAVCDIWEYSKRYASRYLKAKGHVVNVYEDYRVMLDKEKDLDAVIVATPDWMHAEHAIAAMEAGDGHHVYCEKEMSNHIPLAADMVKAAKECGKMLQIGHQRRSSPIYLHAHKLINSGEICGKIKNCYGQWNRPAQAMMKCPKKLEMPAEKLKKYEYDSMKQFMNWRWFRKYSAGPIADLGSHQIDIFSWFLGGEPSSLTAVGGSDYYSDREWYEDVMVIYEYDTERHGKARGFYQVLNTTGFGGFFERFMGDEGTLTISENPNMCYYVTERGASQPSWFEGVTPVNKNGHMAIPFVDALDNRDEEVKKDIAEYRSKRAHRFHLENFFHAVRNNDKKLLTCPAEVAYGTAKAVLNVIPVIETGKKMAISDDAAVGPKKDGEQGWDRFKKVMKTLLD